MNIKMEKHIDGKWKTSYTYYKDRQLVLKSRPMHGMKIHSILNGRVEFTLRYYFIEPLKLIELAKLKIDKLNML